MPSAISGELADRIVGELRKAGGSGLRAETLRAAVGVAKAASLRTALAPLIRARRVTKRGEKRLTTYYAGPDVRL